MFLGSLCQNEFNSHHIARIGEKKIFMNRRTSFLQSRNHYFLGSRCQNESNSQYPDRIGEKKIFHELDVHDVYKVRITCFWAQDAKMSLTTISLLESARRKFSMNSNQREENFSSTRRTEENFHELDVHHVYKVGITSFWAQDAKMSLTANTPLESARRKFFMNSTYIMSTK